MIFFSSTSSSAKFFWYFSQLEPVALGMFAVQVRDLTQAVRKMIGGEGWVKRVSGKRMLRELQVALLWMAGVVFCNQ